MPQPKSNRSSRSQAAGRNRSARAASSKRAAAKPAPAKAAPAKRPAPKQSDAVREQLTRLLNPLDMVVLSRERLQEAFDDAVRRGRMTRADASELVATLFERGRRTTDDLLADVEQLLGRSREQLGERVGREVDRARRAAGLGPSFPISGYDDLTAAQVNARLGDLTPAELRKVRDYERRNANRKSVLGAIEQKLK